MYLYMYRHKVDRGPVVTGERCHTKCIKYECIIYIICGILIERMNRTDFVVTV